MLKSAEIDQLIAFRKELHQHPELSGNEHQTAQRIRQFIEDLNPTEVVSNIGGAGLAAIWEGKSEGQTVLIRAELDALPIQEMNEFEHKSNTEGIAHKCGHDGHMTILCGLAVLLNKLGLDQGKVILLFQPAEETGQGAKAVLSDSKFTDLAPDVCFALHNIPKKPVGQVLTKSGVFCAASTGMKIKLVGKTAHASQPETGISPNTALAQLIFGLNKIADDSRFLDKTTIATTHMKMGKESFGVSAGNAELWLTIRAFDPNDFMLLQALITKEVETISGRHSLQYDISYHERFEATNNHDQDFEAIKVVASENGFDFEEMKEPNAWSEDFGLFLAKYCGAMFGFGSGESTPDLHNPDYDFPDDLIEKGVKMFWSLIQNSIK